jgi:hypothetical protein
VPFRVKEGLGEILRNATKIPLISPFIKGVLKGKNPVKNCIWRIRIIYVK